MVKEGIEDWRRKQQDIEVNNRKVKVHDGNGIFWQEEWSNLIVGDIVRVEKDEFFSTDLLLLSSSYEDSICYVETMNLDGETNLKVKQGLEATSSLLHEDSDFKVLVRCEDPNVNLYVFVGTLALEKERFPLSIQQILLRDYKLRNTEYVYGAVVFTGHDTKTDIDEACKAEDYDFQPILKAYQLVGVNFLLLLYKKGIEGADEMGLGKTIQAITYLTLLNHLNNDPGPHLVVCPASVLENWERELRKWCPLFTIVQYHGAARAAYSRKLQRNNCILVEGAIEKGSTVYPPTRFHWKI